MSKKQIQKQELFGKNIDVADEPVIKYFYNLIMGEQTLINSRITWMMTFQGFLFAAFAIAISDQCDIRAKDLLYRVLPIIGMLVAFLAEIGIIAAICSISNIKLQFKNSKYYHSWPPPYSNSIISIFGRISALSFPIVIILTWLYIVI